MAVTSRQLNGAEPNFIEWRAACGDAEWMLGDPVIAPQLSLDKDLLMDAHPTLLRGKKIRALAIVFLTF